MENQSNIWINGNRKYFRLDDGTVMHRPLTVEEKIKLNPKDDIEMFNLYMNMEENFGTNALKVIKAFKK